MSDIEIFKIFIDITMNACLIGISLAILIAFFREPD